MLERTSSSAACRGETQCAQGGLINTRFVGGRVLTRRASFECRIILRDCAVSNLSILTSIMAGRDPPYVCLECPVFGRRRDRQRARWVDRYPLCRRAGLDPPRIVRMPHHLSWLRDIRLPYPALDHGGSRPALRMPPFFTAVTFTRRRSPSLPSRRRGNARKAG